MVIARRQSGTPGWEIATVSLRPGEHVDVRIRSGLADAGAIAQTLEMARALFDPAIRRTDPYTEE